MRICLTDVYTRIGLEVSKAHSCIQISTDWRCTHTTKDQKNAHTAEYKNNKNKHTIQVETPKPNSCIPSQIHISFKAQNNKDNLRVLCAPRQDTKLYNSRHNGSFTYTLCLETKASCHRPGNSL